MGMRQSRETGAQIYLTIRNLVGGFLSYKELHGPIGIAKVAYKVAERGIPELLIFLGFLSINLAVLNFLPIPVLDGGHMVFLIWEGVTRRRPSEKVMIMATYCGLIFVLGLMALVIYLDLFVHKIGV
jgi:regulator of sigma E protease